MKPPRWARIPDCGGGVRHHGAAWDRDGFACTFSLCAIPDERQAVSEMARVLRPGGLLLLADHVAAAAWPARACSAS